MRFEFEGRRYQLVFKREHKTIEVVRDGKTIAIKSQYPYTTVLLQERTTVAPVIVGMATVGCMPNDTYSNEKGRLMALRSLTETLTKREVFNRDFREVMWKAYQKRGEGQKNANVIDVITTKVENGPTTPLALPPAPEAANVVLH